MKPIEIIIVGLNFTIFYCFIGHFSTDQLSKTTGEIAVNESSCNYTVVQYLDNY